MLRVVLCAVFAFSPFALFCDSEYTIERQVSIGDFIDYYYLHDEPQLLVPIIETLAKEEHLSNAFPFLATAFKSYTGTLPELLSKLSLNASDRKTLLCAYFVSGKDGNEILDLARQDHWPLNEIAALQDQVAVDFSTIKPSNQNAVHVLWQAFFASGDLVYPKNLLSVFDLEESEFTSPEQKDEMIQSIKNNFVQYAWGHELLYRFCQTELPVSQGRKREALVSVLESCHKLQTERFNGANENLQAFLFLSNDPEYLKNWFQRAHGDNLEIKGAATLKKGEKAQVELLFTNYELDDKLCANVSYDLAVYGPDGELSDYHENITALVGKTPSHFFIQRPMQWTTLQFPEDAPLGQRTVVVRLVDHNAGESFEIETQFELVE